MISVREFLVRARLERHSLEAWNAAGWLIPPQTEPEPTFSDVDLARAQLIRDLREDFGVNDEGVTVILHLRSGAGRGPCARSSCALLPRITTMAAATTAISTIRR